MSQYDRAINSLLAGKTLHLPLSVNLTSFRRQYNRTLAALKQAGMTLGTKRLHIDLSVEGDKYVAIVVAKQSITYEEVEVQDEHDNSAGT